MADIEELEATVAKRKRQLSQAKQMLAAEKQRDAFKVCEESGHDWHAPSAYFVTSCQRCGVRR